MMKAVGLEAKAAGKAKAKKTDPSGRDKAKAAKAARGRVGGYASPLPSPFDP
jgi:hypothetical protein